MFCIGNYRIQRSNHSKYCIIFLEDSREKNRDLSFKYEKSPEKVELGNLAPQQCYCQSDQRLKQ